MSQQDSIKKALHKIIVVDNERLVSDTCRSTLEPLGYEVLCVNEKQLAVYTQLELFDLAIVHVNLEEKTGLETFKKLRRSNPTIAGVLISGNTDLNAVIETMNSGFSRVCLKPLDTKKLIKAIEETLEITTLQDNVSRMKILMPLYALGKKFITAESEQGIYEELIDAVLMEVKVFSASLMMFDNETNSLKVVAYRGINTCYINNLQIKSGEQIAGKVFQNQTPVILNRSNQHLSPYPGLLQRDELSASISFPISNKGKVLGVLNISSTQTDVQFSDVEIEMLAVIVDQALMALENIRLNREREEYSRIKTQLEQYVSPEVSKMLMKRKQPLLEMGSVQELTVLFADIRNFTILVQHLDPALLRLFLNDFFDMFCGIVFSYQGMLDKFMGDAALVIFGAPVKIDQPNIAAVSAANTIMIKFEKLRAGWEKKYPVFARVGLGIGISRGQMFLGNIGSSQRLDYTVIGADVNIAQRLASATLSGEVLITDKVHRSINGKFRVGIEKKMLLKGMEEQVTVFALSPFEEELR